MSRLRNVDATRTKEHLGKSSDNIRLFSWDVRWHRELSTRAAGCLTQLLIASLAEPSEQRVNRTIKCPFHEVLSNFSYIRRWNDPLSRLSSPRIRDTFFFLHRYARGAILHAARNAFINTLVNKSSNPLPMINNSMKKSLACDCIFANIQYLAKVSSYIASQWTNFILKHQNEGFD